MTLVPVFNSVSNTSVETAAVVLRGIKLSTSCATESVSFPLTNKSEIKTKKAKTTECIFLTQIVMRYIYT